MSLWSRLVVVVRRLRLLSPSLRCHSQPLRIFTNLAEVHLSVGREEIYLRQENLQTRRLPLAERPFVGVGGVWWSPSSRRRWHGWWGWSRMLRLTLWSIEIGGLLVGEGNLVWVVDVKDGVGW